MTEGVWHGCQHPSARHPDAARRLMKNMDGLQEQENKENER
jgi:hypothetical protein